MVAVGEVLPVGDGEGVIDGVLTGGESEVVGEGVIVIVIVGVLVGVKVGGGVTVESNLNRAIVA